MHEKYIKNVIVVSVTINCIMVTPDISLSDPPIRDTKITAKCQCIYATLPSGSTVLIKTERFTSTTANELQLSPGTVVKLGTNLYKCVIGMGPVVEQIDGDTCMTVTIPSGIKMSTASGIEIKTVDETEGTLPNETRIVLHKNTMLMPIDGSMLVQLVSHTDAVLTTTRNTMSTTSSDSISVQKPVQTTSASVQQPVQTTSASVQKPVQTTSASVQKPVQTTSASVQKPVQTTSVSVPTTKTVTQAPVAKPMATTRHAHLLLMARATSGTRQHKFREKLT
jgi:hypothetical protein